MKATADQIRRYFQPVIGCQPLRVRPGVGSFLTFEFGPRVKAYGHLQAHWRLWIYLSTWKLFHKDHFLIDWNADHERITRIAHRIEEEASSLTEVNFDLRARKTIFSFGDFRLEVSPADYLEDIDERDDYWIFFMPDNKTVALGPAGIQEEQTNARHSSLAGKKVEIRETKPGQIRLDT